MPRRRRLVSARLAAAVAVIAASVAGPGTAPAQAAGVVPAGVLAGPSLAGMYPSGHTVDGARDRLVVADTGLDRVLFFDASTGAPEGGFGTPGSGDGQFDSPRDTAVDARSDIYVADAGNNRVQKFDSAGRHLWTVGGTGSCTACLNTPIGVHWDEVNGVLLVASTGQSLVKAFGPDGSFRWKSPPGSSLGFTAPRDVTRGLDGRLWVTAYKQHQLKGYQVSAGGAWAPLSAANPVILGDGVANGHGTGQMNFPYNIEFSPDGATGYISDTGSDRVVRYDFTDPARPVWMPPFGATCTYPCPDPPAPAAVGRFEHLRRVAVHPATGAVTAADFWGNGLQTFDPSGAVVTMIDGAAAPAPGFAEPHGVATGGDGTIYVMDRLNQRIERFAPDGTYLNQVGTRGVGAGRFSWPEALAVGPDGTVWAADTRNDRLQRFAADLSGTPVVVGGPGTSAGRFSYPEGIAVGPDGVVWVADTRNHRLQAYDPAARTFTTVGAAGSGPGQFSDPEGVAVTATAVFVADTGNDRIQKLSSAGRPLAEYSIGLSAPEGVAVATDGTVWVADTGNHRMVHLSSDLTGLGDGFGGPGTGEFGFDRPHSLAVSGTTVYVADTYNHRVSRYTVASGAPGPDPGWPPTPAGRIFDPAGVAPLYPAGGDADEDGNLYVADSGGSRIVRIDPDGQISPLPATGWNDPRDTELDPDGAHLWVADTSDSQIVKLTRGGTVVATYGGPADLKTPYGLAVDADGVYVADTYNHRVVRLAKATGARQWAQGTCGGKAFKRPRDVGMGPDGKLYVADTDNGRIAVLEPSTGACLRAFGAPGAGNGQFRSPRAVASDGGNGIWVADAGNSRVQHLSATGAFMAKTSGGFGSADGQYRSAHCAFVDASGTLHVCDTFNHRIQRYTVNAAGVPTWAGLVGGTAPAPGGFNGPFDAAYGPGGELYVADWFNHRISKFNPDGSFDRQWGGYGAPSGSLIFPRGVTLDGGGNLVVTDSENNRLDLFRADGVFVRSIKPAVGTPFLRPHQTAIAPDGTYWVADTGNARVLHLGPTGTVLGSITGLGAPRGIAVDAAGRVYVSDATRSRVEQYSAAGTHLATLATAGSGGTSVRTPHGLRVAVAGGEERLFVADTGNHRVLILDLDGTAAGALAQPGAIGPKGVGVGPGGVVAVAEWGSNAVGLWRP